MSFLSNLVQAASVYMSSQNIKWQQEYREQQLLSAVDVEALRQEHQLKMTYLQQELQQPIREQERQQQVESQKNSLINQAHIEQSKFRDSERYLRGTWKEVHFGNDSPPYVIFCINPQQDFNQFKEAIFRIAPFQRTYDNLKMRNSKYLSRLFSTITISETFKSEAEVRNFFYRELNCPCIIVYGLFTGTGFSIYAFTAGMSPEQITFKDKKLTNWGINIEKIWDISFSTIVSLQQKSLENQVVKDNAILTKRRADLLEHLELMTDTHVGLCIQVILDNYFSYFPRNIYEVKTPVFLEAKQKELTRLGIWDSLKGLLLERYDFLKGRQSKIKTIQRKNLSINKTNRNEFRNFIAFDVNSFRLNEKKEWVVKSSDNKTHSIITIEKQSHSINIGGGFVENFYSNNSHNIYEMFNIFKSGLGKYGIKTFFDEIIFEPIFDDITRYSHDYILGVKKESYWGLVDIDGNEISPFKYSGVYYLGQNKYLLTEFIENTRKTEYEIYNIINNRYNKINLEDCFKQIRKYTTWDVNSIEYCTHFNTFQAYEDDYVSFNIFRYASGSNNGFQFILNKFGSVKLIYDAKKSPIFFSEGKIIINQFEDSKKSYLFGYANPEYYFHQSVEKFIIPPLFSSAMPFKEGIANVEMNEKWGSIDKKNIIIIPLEYDYIECFTNGVAIAKKNKKWGLISNSNEVILPFLFTRIIKNHLQEFEVEIAADYDNSHFAVINNEGKILVK